MNLKGIDLNLLVYLDVLLHKKNVTRAAEALGISQPAMSNSLQRLRKLFGDPLLVRTSQGMMPTERAEELRPAIRSIVSRVERAVQPVQAFEPTTSDRLFRIAVGDYAESTIMPELLRKLRSEAPNITLDLLTPSDVSLEDVEHGNVDMVINRFESLPDSFHQKIIWHDSFACLINRENPIRDHWDLEHYLESDHVWVSKTGMGQGVGVEPGDKEHLGWVDDALARLGKTRHNRVFTRHYKIAMQLTELKDLVVTLPTRAACLMADDPSVIILEPPFEIPEIELIMAWGPLVNHTPAHRWLRRIITTVTRDIASATRDPRLKAASENYLI